MESDKVKAQRRAYYEKNKEKIKARLKVYRAKRMADPENRAAYNAYQREYCFNRRRADPEFRKSRCENSRKSYVKQRQIELGINNAVIIEGTADEIGLHDISRTVPAGDVCVDH